jgi:hypothetical protein
MPDMCCRDAATKIVSIINVFEFNTSKTARINSFIQYQK